MKTLQIYGNAWLAWRLTSQSSVRTWHFSAAVGSRPPSPKLLSRRRTVSPRFQNRSERDYRVVSHQMSAATTVTVTATQTSSLRMPPVVGQTRPTRICRIIRSRLRPNWSHCFAFADHRRPVAATAVGRWRGTTRSDPKDRPALAGPFGRGFRTGGVRRTGAAGVRGRTRRGTGAAGWILRGA